MEDQHGDRNIKIDEKERMDQSCLCSKCGLLFITIKNKAEKKGDQQKIDKEDPVEILFLFAVNDLVWIVIRKDNKNLYRQCCN